MSTTDRRKQSQWDYFFDFEVLKKGNVQVAEVARKGHITQRIGS